MVGSLETPQLYVRIFASFRFTTVLMCFVGATWSWPLLGHSQLASIPQLLITMWSISPSSSFIDNAVMTRLARKSMIFLFLQARQSTNPILRHGSDWEVYKKLVPYRIIPFIYWLFRLKHCLTLMLCIKFVIVHTFVHSLILLGEWYDAQVWLQDNSKNKTKQRGEWSGSKMSWSIRRSSSMVIADSSKICLSWFAIGGEKLVDGPDHEHIQHRAYLNESPFISGQTSPRPRPLLYP